MIRKELRAEKMFQGIIKEMREFQVSKKQESKTAKIKMELPSWM